MTAVERRTFRAHELYRHVDAKDVATLRSIWCDDPQKADEMTRGWLRGQPALQEYFGIFARIEDIHSTVEDVAVRRWGEDVEIETFVLRQSYVYEGVRHEAEGPVTTIWHREGGSWKLALVHSVSLPPPT
jgi:ketosteroid isomerase-like protein